MTEDWVRLTDGIGSFQCLEQKAKYLQDPSKSFWCQTVTQPDLTLKWT